MFRSVLSRAMLVCIALLPCTKSTAGVPLIISHQGRLLDASDVPLSGSFTIIYSIHDAPVGGSQLWLEDHIGVVVADGLFTVQLGTSVPLTADIMAGSGGGSGSVGRYLQVQISGQPPIMPRTQLVSTPYSIASSRLDGDVVTAPGMLTISDGSQSIKTDCDDSTSVVAILAGVAIPKFIDITARAEGSTIRQGSLGGTASIESDCDDTTATFGILAGVAVPKFIDVTAKSDRSSVTVGSSVGGLSIESACDDTSSTLAILAGVAIPKFIDLTTQAQRSSIRQGSIGGNVSIESDCDDSTATFGILAGVAIPKFIDLTARASGSSIRQGSTAGGVSIESDCDDSTATFGILAGVAIPKFIDLTTQANRSSIRQGSTAGGLSIESACDDTSAKFAILAGVAIPKFIDVTAQAHRSSVTLGSSAGGVSIESACDDSTSKFAILAGVAVPKFINITAEPKRSSMRVGSGSGNLGVTSSSDDSTATLGILAGVAIPRFINVTSEAHRSSLSIGSTVTKGRLECDDIDTRLALTPSGSGSYGFELRCGESSGSLPPSSSACFTSDTGDTTFIIHGDGRLGLGVGDPSHFVDVQGGAYCDGTNWVNASDANSKENFESVDGGEILEKISDLEITKWNYRGNKDAQHIGPTAQDFKRTFGVGADDKSISTIDPSGIALAAIKELSRQNQEFKVQSQEILQKSRELAIQNRNLEEQNDMLKQRLDDLARKVEQLASRK